VNPVQYFLPRTHLYVRRRALSIKFDAAPHDLQGPRGNLLDR
jgi:hypothetical protein